MDFTGTRCEEGLWIQLVLYEINCLAIVNTAINFRVPVQLSASQEGLWFMQLRNHYK